MNTTIEAQSAAPKTTRFSTEPPVAAAATAPLPLANTRLATIIGFVHFFVMLLTLTIYSNLIQLSPNYRRAAADLGANAFQTFWHVILPLTLPGIMTGAFLTFVLCIGDYITPQILGGNNELLMPQLIMMQIGRRGDFASASRSHFSNAAPL